ncbi:DNA cytosine methyltransferase [Agrobacterium pusense]|nr:DNA cytosine methyltransferase [Agrobacterium pusense]QWW74149.1 DNA cytosine methyltransferase [Agrobacterium pusense]
MQHANDNHTGLRFLSVCSGIEAASVAWHPLGWQCIGVAEIEPFPAFVLAHHYGAGRPRYMPDPGEPGIKPRDQRSRKTALKAVSRLPVDSVLTNWGDFTKIDAKTLGRVDILAGGTPCQAFSVAGLRLSLADARGNLSLEFVRLAHELAANNGLRNVVWENVVGVLSTKDNAFGCFLAGLVGAHSAIEPPRRGRWARHGMVSGPKGRAAWAVKDGQFFGVAQRRRRVLVVADFGNGADPAAVLFEPESMFRHTPPSREAGKSITHPVAPSLVSSGRGIERTGDTRGQDPVVAVLRGHSDYGPGLPSVRAKGGDCAGGSEALVFAPEIARCVATREGSSQDYETTTMVAVAGTLCKDSFSGGMGGRPEGAAAGHFIAHAIQAGALRTNPNSGPDGVGVQEGVAYTLEARAEVQAVCVTGDVAHTLKAEGADASEDGTGRGTPIVSVVPIDMRQASRGATMTNNRKEGSSGGAPGTGIGEDGDPCPTISTSHPPAVSVAIRGRDGGATAELGGDIATALRASQGGGDKPHVLAFHENQRSEVSLSDTAGTLGVGGGKPGQGYPAALTGSAVRRLTPVECERLQGFEDNYTRITIKHYATQKITKNRPADMWEKDPNGGWWLMAADGPRYKSLGNSWAVPKFQWLGMRLDAAYKSLRLGQTPQGQPQEASKRFSPANDVHDHEPQRSQKHAG